MPDRSWVRSLRPGDEVEERYVVRSKELRQRRGGGAYLALTLGDKTGEVAALAWDNAEQLGKLCEPGRVIDVQGQVQRYNNRLQLVVRQAGPVAAEEIDEGLFVRSSTTDPELLWQKMTTLIEEVPDPHVRQLLFRVFADPEVARLFRVAPAARGMHHAFRSGLLEHTVSTATVARSMARHYDADESLVVGGALLHDLGKIWELEIGSAIEYTDQGRLLGHLTMEVVYVDRVLAELPTFPQETRRHLLHILLSHHGEYAYGSPRRPKTPEALLVHLVDTLDSKMAGMREAIEEDTDDAWSQYSRILERFVYRRRPPTDNGQE